MNQNDKAQKEVRPNIVFVITDQQRYDTIAAAGFDYMLTPNLDRLVREGVFFSHMFVTSPSCAPSRASLFTGLYPHTNGVFRNDEPWTHTWVRQMAEAGYRCVNVGKMHTSPFEDSFGFHERHVVENKDRANPRLPFFMDNWDKAIWARGFEKPSRLTYRRRSDYRERLGAFVWELPADLHPDNFVPQMAVTWLRRYNLETPFFLQIGIPGPHPPYDPTQEFIDLYAERALPEPIRDQAAMDAEPPPLKKLRAQHISGEHDAVVHLAHPTPEQTRRQRQHYYANVSMIDSQIGNLIKVLEEKGILEDTVVIFTSDHGDSLNDHGHSQKWSMYEQSVRVPGIVWCPGRVEEGRVVDDLVSMFDFGPTILELAGVEKPRWMEAQSLCGYLKGNETRPREYVFSEHAGDWILHGTQFMTMIRGKRWKLVHFIDTEEGQLFDLDDDPREIRNLWGVPQCQDLKRRLLEEILAWRIRSALVTQGWLEAVEPSGSRSPKSVAKQPKQPLT
jgi:arylsulfatase A-like enzyme